MDDRYTCHFPIANSDVDPFDRLRMSALFRLFEEASSAHTEQLGVGRNRLDGLSVLWVLSRMAVSIRRPPMRGESVTLATWPGKTRRTIFPRHYVLQDAGGAPLVRGVALWLLMDRETRRMAFPEKLGLSVDGLELPGALPSPGPLNLPPLPQIAERTARFSELDLNGHLNNTKYLDWMEDLLPLSYHASHFWSQIQINYALEIRPDTAVTLSYAPPQGNEPLFLQGASGETRFFEVRATPGLWPMDR